MANPAAPDRRNGDPRGGRRAWPGSPERRSPESSTARRASARTSGVGSSRRSTGLGYVPNRAARSLVTRRSGSVAVVIGEPTGRLFSDPFFPRLLRGDQRGARGPRPPARPADAGRVAGRGRTGDYLSAGHVDGGAAGQPAQRRSPARPAGQCRRAHGRRRPPAAGHDRDLRRRRQPRRRPGRGRAPHRRRPAGDRDDRRPGGHDRRASTDWAATAMRSRVPIAPATRHSRRSATSPRTAGTRAMERLLKARPTSTPCSPPRT